MTESVERSKNEALSAQVEDIMSLVLSEAGQEKVKILADSLGKDEQSRAAGTSRMLSGAIRDISRHSSEDGDVAKQLTHLKMEVQRLDPSAIDFSKKGSGSRLLGMIPFLGDPLKRYFTQYESAQSVISTIVQSLRNGQMQLVRDNASLEEDKLCLGDDSVRLKVKIELAQELDRKLQYKVDRDWVADEDKKKFVNEELIFPLRQRTMDLQQLLAVCQQGILAAEILIRNNKELIRNVDRGINVTVSALETAVAVALALSNQKLVLDQIQALNSTTNDIIAGTAQRLKTQGIEIQKASVNASLDVEKLKTAFKTIDEAFIDISNFKQKALPEMSRAIGEFTRLTDQASDRIKKLESAQTVLEQAKI